MDPNLTAPGAAVDGSFRSGNPYSSPRTPSTAVAARFLNSLRRESLNVLAAVGIEPSANDDTQLVTAIRALFAAGLPPGQRSMLFSQGGYAGPEERGTFEQIAHFRGSWGCGVAATTPPGVHYLEASGEFYNMPGPQTVTGGHGVTNLDERTQDSGVWLPAKRFMPGDILWLRIWGRLRQNDAVNPRNFYLCLDPNGDVFNKQNAWGSNYATVLVASVPALTATSRTAAYYDVFIVNFDQGEQLILGELVVPHRQTISGKRYQSGAGFRTTWAVDQLAGTGWNFGEPPQGTGLANWGKNTLLGTRWAVSGTQDGTAQFVAYTLEAYMSRNRFN